VESSRKRRKKKEISFCKIRISKSKTFPVGIPLSLSHPSLSRNGLRALGAIRGVPGPVPSPGAQPDCGNDRRGLGRDGPIDGDDDVAFVVVRPATAKGDLPGPPRRSVVSSCCCCHLDVSCAVAAVVLRLECGEETRRRNEKATKVKSKEKNPSLESSHSLTSSFLNPLAPFPRRNLLTFSTTGSSTAASSPVPWDTAGRSSSGVTSLRRRRKEGSSRKTMTTGKTLLLPPPPPLLLTKPPPSPASSPSASPPTPSSSDPFATPWLSRSSPWR